MHTHTVGLIILKLCIFHLEYAILSSDGQLVYLPNPECEVIISPEDISDQEREIHAEFFCGKNNTKTPERYMKIRNHIIDCW